MDSQNFPATQQSVSLGSQGEVEDRVPPCEPASQAPSVDVSPILPLTSLVSSTNANGVDPNGSKGNVATLTERDRVWSFLRASNVGYLRKYCKDYKVLQNGRKLELQVKLFEKLCHGRDNDTIWSSSPDGQSCTDGHRAFHTWCTTRVHDLHCHIAPQLSTQMASVHTPTRNGPAPFSANEFARLIVMLGYSSWRTSA